MMLEKLYFFHHSCLLSSWKMKNSKTHAVNDYVVNSFFNVETLRSECLFFSPTKTDVGIKGKSYSL